MSLWQGIDVCKVFCTWCSGVPCIGCVMVSIVTCSLFVVAEGGVVMFGGVFVVFVVWLVLVLVVCRYLPCSWLVKIW